MSVGRNLEHVEVAAVGASPTYVDVPGVLSWDPNISTDTDPVQADGTTYYTAYSAPSGEGDLTFIDFDEDVVALLNGGTVTTSGTTPDVIDRYVQPGSYSAPAFIISGWIPNADTFHDSRAGLRITAPNATATVVSPSTGQDSTIEWSCTVNFQPDDDNQMLIYELFETAPVITSGVMVPAPNLTTPA